MTSTKRYVLEPHGRKRLELRRDTATGEVAVVLDGRELARVPREALYGGVDFALPDESLLRVWTESGPRGAPFTYVTRNGHPLPGSEGDPARILWLTVMFFWILAALQLFFAVMEVRAGNADGVSIQSATSNLVQSCLFDLNRHNGVISGYVSGDGHTWQKIGDVTVSWPDATNYAGLAVTSHNNSTTNTATFDNALVGYASQDIGDVGQAGSVTLENDLLTIAGAGSDIWSTADSFHFVYQSRGNPFLG